MRSETESPSTSRSEAPRSRPVAIAAITVLALLLALGGALAWAARDRRPSSGRSAEPSRTRPVPEAKFYWETGARPPALVDLDEIRSGGPPPDGIPPIDDPKFVSAREASWLKAREPVIALTAERETRAYPLQILTWHEIVNDVIAGTPVTVTFCPLCNSAIAFSRRVDTNGEAKTLLGSDEAVLDFGTSGRLYRSNLVMYDRQTKSLWIQFTGQSVVGAFRGAELETIPVQIVSWEQVRRAHPDVRVLSRDTGHARSYGRNPYSGYDDIDSSPFLFDGPSDDRLKPMTRVVTVRRGEAAVAYALDALSRQRVVRDGVGDLELVLLFQPGTASALDASDIAESRDIGAVGVFGAFHEGRELTFQPAGDAFRDAETGSTWNLLGEAVDGPLRGARLQPVLHDDTFWFVWAVFHPKTRIWKP